MILVDVYVPAIDRIFDFQLDENTAAGELETEMLQQIKEQEKWLYEEKQESLCIYAFYRECIVDKEKTLAEQGIDTGEKLILL